MENFLIKLARRYINPGRGKLRRAGDVFLFTGIICTAIQIGMKFIFDPLYRKAGLGSYSPPPLPLAITLILFVLGLFLKIRYPKDWLDIQYELVKEEGKKGAGSLQPVEQALVDIWRLESEINNGGLDQYFSIRLVTGRFRRLRP